MERSFEHGGVIEQMQRRIELPLGTTMKATQSIDALVHGGVKIRSFCPRLLNETLAELFVLGAVQPLPGAGEKAINVTRRHVSRDGQDFTEDRLHDRHLFESSGQAFRSAGLSRAKVGTKFHPSARGACQFLDPKGAEAGQGSAERSTGKGRSGLQAASERLDNAQDLSREDGILMAKVNEFMSEHRFQLVNAPYVQAGQTQNEDRSTVVRIDRHFENAACRQVGQTDFGGKTAANLSTQPGENLKKSRRVGRSQYGTK